jgi:putative hemolysin
MPRDRDVDQFVRIANRLGLADDVPLLPRLRALANENVTSLPRKR